jgi:hypothetical protein
MSLYGCVNMPLLLVGPECHICYHAKDGSYADMAVNPLGIFCL